MGPKKKKKAPKNSFSFFLQDFRKENERKGIRFGNMTEVVAAATPQWQTLNSAEKMKYERLAAEYKLAAKNDLSNKFTTTGKSYLEVQNELLLQQQMRNEMMQYITHMVAVLDRKQIQTKNFIFMHSNYYCHDDAGKIVPCEVAVCEFNFAQGAHSDYHQIINPGSIPLGYAFEANQKQTLTHKIPLPPHDLGERNYSKVFNNINGILQRYEENGRLPPVYTFDADIDTVKSTLLVLGRKEGLTEADLRVYPLVKLFFELRNAAGAFAGKTNLAFPSDSLALRELEKDIYNFTPGISCKFHEDTDAGAFCSLSTVRRWGFMLADHCCKDLGINLVPGQHIAFTSSVWKTQLSPGPATKVQNPVAKDTIPCGNIDGKNVSDSSKRCLTPLTIIDHSKKMDSFDLGATSTTESSVNVQHIRRGRMSQTTNSVERNVRLPYSRGIAMQNALGPSPMFTSEDFPVFPETVLKTAQKTREPDAESLTAPGGLFGQVPVRVAGRGSVLANKSTGAIPKRGRALGINFKGLSLGD